MDTVDANRRFYAVAGEDYDRRERISSSRSLGHLHERLTAALAIAPRPVRALDACGGSGNASLMLHTLGVSPTTVDVSPEMLRIYEREAAARGVEPRTHEAEIQTFLAEDTREWDLIVFTRALHHLDDYVGVLELAAKRLAPGGVLVTAFDPAASGPLGRRLRRVDYILHVVLRDPRRALPLIQRRVRRAAPDTQTILGERAERHAAEGIDDVELSREIEAMGLEVVDHDRIYEGRFLATGLLFRLIRSPTVFSLIVRRPVAEST